MLTEITPGFSTGIDIHHRRETFMQTLTCQAPRNKTLLVLQEAPGGGGFDGNSATFKFTAAGTLTIGTINTIVVTSLSATTVGCSTFQMSGAGSFTTNNFTSANPNNSGTSSTTTTSGLLILGAATMNYRTYFQGNSSAPGVNTSYASTIWGVPFSVTMAASGTHAIYTQIAVKPLTITTGAATLTNGVTLYIEDAPNLGTNKYAFWSDAGQNRLDGNTGIGVAPTTTSYLTLGACTTALSSLNLPTGTAPSSPVDGDVWREDNTNTGLKIRVNGVTKTISLV